MRDRTIIKSITKCQANPSCLIEIAHIEHNTAPLSFCIYIQYCIYPFFCMCVLHVCTYICVYVCVYVCVFAGVHRVCAGGEGIQ